MLQEQGGAVMWQEGGIVLQEESAMPQQEGGTVLQHEHILLQEESATLQQTVDTVLGQDGNAVLQQGEGVAAGGDALSSRADFADPMGQGGCFSSAAATENGEGDAEGSQAVQGGTITEVHSEAPPSLLHPAVKAALPSVEPWQGAADGQRAALLPKNPAVNMPTKAVAQVPYLRSPASGSGTEVAGASGSCAETATASGSGAAVAAASGNGVATAGALAAGASAARARATVAAASASLRYATAARGEAAMGRGAASAFAAARRQTRGGGALDVGAPAAGANAEMESGGSALAEDAKEGLSATRICRRRASEAHAGSASATVVGASAAALGAEVGVQG